MTENTEANENNTFSTPPLELESEISIANENGDEDKAGNSIATLAIAESNWEKQMFEGNEINEKECIGARSDDESHQMMNLPMLLGRTSGETKAIPTLWSDEPVQNEAIAKQLVADCAKPARMSQNIECDMSGRTLMIRNIPIGMSQRDVLKELSEIGLDEEIVVLYVPCNFTSKSPAQKNYGYGFIHLKSQSAVRLLQKRWHNEYPFPKYFDKDSRPINIANAKVQGAEKNLACWNLTKTSRIRSSNFKPMVFDERLRCKFQCKAPQK